MRNHPPRLSSPWVTVTPVLAIAVSSRSLAAARTIDPDVSPAAVYAAVEAAIAEHLRQLGATTAEKHESPRRAG
jgi:hypothetical protein